MSAISGFIKGYETEKRRSELEQRDPEVAQEYQRILGLQNEKWELLDLAEEIVKLRRAVKMVWFDEVENQCRFCQTIDPCSGDIERCDHSVDCVALEAQKNGEQTAEALATLNQKTSETIAYLTKENEGLREYITLLGEELSEIVPLASIHGWESSRYEQGKILREKYNIASSEAQRRNDE